jgi:NAD(P)-dependent dehydrogenase (short-subunit alcohol dehydrogenase family)
MTETFPRTAIVTGSDSGIGRATAVALARAGCDVGVTWHSDEDGARGTAKEITELGRRAEVRQLDLTRLPAAADVIDELADALGGVDVLVNNSGTGTATPLLDIDYDTWRTVLATDLDGAFLCLQRAARRMIAAGRGGRIVNITSVHEHQPRVGAAPYCAAKGGLGLLTRTAALELAEHGITVNAVAPGLTESDGVKASPHNEAFGFVEMLQAMPGKGQPEHIADVVAFLASDDARWITGQTLNVDAGMVRH